MGLPAHISEEISEHLDAIGAILPVPRLWLVIDAGEGEGRFEMVIERTYRPQPINSEVPR